MKRQSLVRTTPGTKGSSPLGNERGMILAITMMILLVISTIAAASLVNSFLERSLARNQASATIAQNAVDAGVAEALAWLNDPTRDPCNPSTIPKTPGCTAVSAVIGPGADWNHTITGKFKDIGTLSGEANYNENDNEKDEKHHATYTSTIRFRRENDAGAPERCDTELPADGCANNEVVLYNRCTAGPADNCWEYNESAFASPNGYPVIVVRSEGRYGAGAIRVVEMEVARDKFDIKATGAVTAASSVEASGSIKIDGRSHTINGSLGGVCTTAFPGASVPPPLVDQNGDGVCNCTNGVSNGDDDCADTGESGTMDRGCYKATKQGAAAALAGDPTEWATNNVTPPLTPDSSLGLAEGDLEQKLGDLPGSATHPGLVITKGNITYHNQDFDLLSGGLGVLIVHNPLFDSAKHSWSDPVGEHYKANFRDAADTADVVNCAGRIAVDGGGNPVYPTYDRNLDTACPGNFVADATYPTQAAYRSAKQPRNLEQHGTNTFKGVIIADKVDQINGNALIIGALISLSTVSVDKLGNGSAQILYSCDAISLYTDVGYSIKLSWHRIR